MTGNSTLIINQDTMREAIQFWLRENQFKVEAGRTLKVARVVTQDEKGDNGAFQIDLEFAEYK